MGNMLLSERLPASWQSAPEKLQIDSTLRKEIEAVKSLSAKDQLEHGFCIESAIANETARLPNDATSSLRVTNNAVGTSGAVDVRCPSEAKARFHTHPGGSWAVPSPHDFISSSRSSIHTDIVIDDDGAIAIAIDTAQSVKKSRLTKGESSYEIASFMHDILMVSDESNSEKLLLLAMLCEVNNQVCYYSLPNEVDLKKISFSHYLQELVDSDKHHLLYDNRKALRMFISWLNGSPDLRNKTFNSGESLSVEITRTTPSDDVKVFERRKTISPFFLNKQNPFYMGIGRTKDAAIWDTFSIWTGKSWEFGKEHPKGLRRPDLDRLVCVQIGQAERARFGPAGKSNVALSVWHLDIDQGSIETSCWERHDGAFSFHATQQIKDGQLHSRMSATNFPISNRVDDYASICLDGEDRRKPDGCDEFYKSPTMLILK